MQDFSTTGRDPVSTLRINAREQDKILRLLDAEQNTSPHAVRRKSDRRPLPEGVGVTACITQPGGSSGHYLVRGLNLSDNGIGFIHGGFVHCGSRTVVTLITAEGERFSVNGTVKRCEYVTNGVHAVGVAFDAPFDLDGFLGGVEDDAGAGTGKPAKTRSVRVQGRVLILDDSSAARRLTAYLLNRIGAAVVEAHELDEACRELLRQPFDLLLCDVWLGDLDLSQFIGRLQQAAGTDTAIVAFTGDERKSTHQSVLAAGCVEVLLKPIAPVTFNEAIARHLPAAEELLGSSTQRTVVSEHWNDLAMRPLIMRFVRDLEAMVRQLDLDLSHIESPRGKLSAYNACMRIGADAAAYGFPSIQSIGNTMCMLIDGGAEAAELQSQLMDLQARVDAACRGI